MANNISTILTKPNLSNPAKTMAVMVNPDGSTSYSDAVVPKYYFADGDTLSNADMWSISPYIIFSKFKALPDIDFTKTPYQEYFLYVLNTNAQNADLHAPRNIVAPANYGRGQLNFYDAYVYVNKDTHITRPDGTGTVLFKHHSEGILNNIAPLMVVNTSPDGQLRKDGLLMIDSCNMQFGNDVSGARNSSLQYIQISGDSNATGFLKIGTSAFDLTCANCSIMSQTYDTQNKRLLYYDFNNVTLSDCLGGNFIGHVAYRFRMTGYLDGNGTYKPPIALMLISGGVIDIDGDIDPRDDKQDRSYIYASNGVTDFNVAYGNQIDVEFSQTDNSKMMELFGEWVNCKFDFKGYTQHIVFDGLVENPTFANANKASINIANLLFNDTNANFALNDISKLDILAGDITCYKMYVQNIPHFYLGYAKILSEQPNIVGGGVNQFLMVYCSVDAGDSKTSWDSLAGWNGSFYYTFNTLSAPTAGSLPNMITTGAYNTILPALTNFRRTIKWAKQSM